MSDDVLFRLIQELEELSVARGQLLARIEMLLSVQRERRPNVVSPTPHQRVSARTEIEKVFQDAPRVRSVEELIGELRDRGVHAQVSSVRTLLHDLVKDGILSKPERGRYELSQRGIQDPFLAQYSNDAAGTNGDS